MAKVGDKIRIIYMYKEPQYAGKEGVIKKIGVDPWGDEFWHGTWGGCSVYPKVDSVEII